MRKIAVFARGLMMSVCVLLTMTACSEEELVAPEENGGADNNTTITTPTDVPMKTIRISAGMAQGEGDEMTRTTLNGQKVLWDEGDQFTVAYGYDRKLTVLLNKVKSGLAIKSSFNNDKNSVMVKYDGISVISNGKDVTKDLVSSDITSNKDNSLAIGMNNPGNNYKLPEPGQEFTTLTKSTKHPSVIGLIRISSSSTAVLSDNNPTIVTMQDLQYKDGTDANIPWVDVTENSEFVNGAYWDVDDVKDFYFSYGKGDLTLTDEPGKTYGEFQGQVAASTVVDENTRAVYPATSLKSYRNGVMTIDIPETQEYVENSFDHRANIMVGEVEVALGDKYDATFKNMMSTIAIPLTGDNDFISEITLTDKGGNLWGTATIAANAYTAGISTSNITDGGNSIKMICKEPVELTSEAKTFYFVVPVGAFKSGMDVKVTTTDKREMTKSASTLSVERNKLIKLPTLAGDFPIYIHNVENDELQKYLNSALTSYTTWTSATYFSTTSIKNAVKDQDHPRYYNASWAGQANATYYITLTDNTKGVNVFENRPVSGTNYDIMNLVPGHEYKYVVTDGSKNISSGKFKATGRVRMITVDDTWNFRDMGGWTGLNGNKVQYELLYRCGSLNGKCKYISSDVPGASIWQLWNNDKIKRDNVANPDNYALFTDKSLEQLQDLKIKGELDLRALRSQRDATPEPHAYSINTGHTRVDNWDFKQIMFNDVQTAPLDKPRSDAVIDCMAWIIKQVVYNNNPVAFHCKSGADRTGMLAYLIHALLGVELTGLAVDFETTNFSHEQKEVIGKSEFRNKILKDNVTGMFDDSKNFMKCEKGTNRQEKAYYYLNQYFDKRIKSSDLDKFIEKMLGMEAGTYQHPSFAEDNGVTITKDN